MALLTVVSMCHPFTRQEKCSKYEIHTQNHKAFHPFHLNLSIQSISSTTELTYEAEKAVSNSQQTALLGNEMQELGSFSDKHYVNSELGHKFIECSIEKVILYLWKPFFVHMIHHYYFTVKGNWGATRARGEKKARYYLQISHQNPSKSIDGHNAVSQTAALPKFLLW